MKFTKLVNDYTQCNKFEIQIIDEKVKIFYYDNIKNFSSNKIVISKNNRDYTVKGKNLVIETMFLEYLIISGEINLIELGKSNE